MYEIWILGQGLFCSWRMSNCSNTVFCKGILPLLNYFCTFVKNQLGIFVFVCFWVLYSAQLIYMSVSPPVPNCLHYCSNILIFTSILFQDCLAIPVLLPFHINFKISWPIPAKIPFWDFERNYTTTIHQFGENWHLFYVEPSNP